jgi:hypothetical protein
VYRSPNLPVFVAEGIQGKQGRGQDVEQKAHATDLRLVDGVAAAIPEGVIYSGIPSVFASDPVN